MAALLFAKGEQLQTLWYAALAVALHKPKTNQGACNSQPLLTTNCSSLLLAQTLPAFLTLGGATAEGRCATSCFGRPCSMLRLYHAL